MCKQKSGRELIRVSIFSYIFGIFIIIRYTSMLYTLSFQIHQKSYIFGIFIIIRYTSMLYTLSFQIHQKHVFFSSYQHFSAYKRVYGNRKMKNWKAHRITLDLQISIKILSDVIGYSLYSNIKWQHKCVNKLNKNYSISFLYMGYIETTIYMFGKRFPQHSFRSSYWTLIISVILFLYKLAYKILFLANSSLKSSHNEKYSK